MTTYKDKRGWKYRVMGGIGGYSYKGRYLKPGTLSWHCMTQLPWRKTKEEAQKDLDIYAQKKGMVK